MNRLIVTIDGPAGSGKSTGARQLAQRLGVEFLDTGAMYRGIGVWAKRQGLDTATQTEAVSDLAERSKIEFDWSTDPPRLLVDGVDLTDDLRTPEATQGSSDVAQMPRVRKVLVREQQRVGSEHPRLVTEGRDQGSVVFPDATVKFYLDADAGERARRRAAQMREAGQDVDEDELRRKIEARDQRDASRADGPLVCPEDAIRIDTTLLTLEQVIEQMEREVRARAADAIDDIGNAEAAG